MGCKIEDIASDPEINDICEAFKAAKALQELSKVSTSSEMMLREAGILADPELHLALENTWAEYLIRERQNDRAS